MSRRATNKSNTFMANQVEAKRKLIILAGRVKKNVTTIAEDASLRRFLEILDWSVREVQEHNR